MTTTWRWGVHLDTRTADMLDEAQRLSGVRITCTQGSFSGGVEQSAGTHDGCGAVDLSASGLNSTEADALILAMRQVGFAAWLRSPDQGNWPWHCHAVAVQPGGGGDRGCLSSGAHDQVADYLAGRNGLASNAPDDGPRDFHYVGITWEEYRDGAKDDGKDTAHDEEEDDMLMVEAPGRGVALIGPGYYHSLNPEERDVMLGSGIRLVKHNDRGFDVARAVCTGGTQDID